MMLGLVLWATALLTAPTATLSPRGSWTLETSDVRCRVVREFNEGTSTRLAIAAMPLTNTYVITPTLPSPISVAYLDPVAVEIEPGSRRARADVFVDSPVRTRQSTFGFQIERSLLPSQDGKIKITVNRQTVADYPLSEFGSARSMLSSCETQLLKGLGVDPAILTKIVRYPEPRQNPAQWMMSNDYPTGARRAAAEGRVIARFDVDETGRPSNCFTALSSGSVDLDAMTCEVILKRGSFTPAIGLTGEPIRSPQLLSMRWVLPR